MIKFFIICGVFFLGIIIFNKIIDLLHLKKEKFDPYFHKNIISKEKYNKIAKKIETVFLYLFAFYCFGFLAYGYYLLIMDTGINIVTVLIGFVIIFLFFLSRSIKDIKY